MKFCKDCKFMKRVCVDDFMGFYDNVCTHKSAEHIDLVTGETRYLLCKNIRHRFAETTCGEQARFFEPKEQT